jgi:Nucleotidyl transferase AbiEii toxin, Type IV TA system
LKRAPSANLAASVHQRLLNLSQERREDFNLILTRYAIERLLARLAQAGYAGQFVLKGALLFAIWTGRLHRPTRDLDLLGYGDSSEEKLGKLFKDLCAVEMKADGLVFDPDSVRVTEIREEQEYGGQRVHLLATLGRARIPLQIDIGFGDAVTPAAEQVEYPALLELPGPRLWAYPKESVVAEKLHAMVALGVLNSRMKDFYDVWTMAQVFPFDGHTLCRAIWSTFERRRTEIPSSAPAGLTAKFAGQADKIVQWKAFLARNRLDVGGAEFARVIDDLGDFLLPPLSAIAGGQDFGKVWPAQGPWTAE